MTATAIVILGDGLHALRLPHAVEAVWRAAYFMLAAVTLGGMWVFLTSGTTMPPSRQILMASLSLVVLRTVVANVERWDSRLYWEGLPLDTVVLVLVGAGLRLWVREQRDRR